MDARQRADAVRDPQQSVSGRVDIASGPGRFFVPGTGRRNAFAERRQSAVPTVDLLDPAGSAGPRCGGGELRRHQGHAPVLWAGGRGVGTRSAGSDILGHGEEHAHLAGQNPFYGIITNPASTSFNQPTIQLNRLLRPYAAYTSVGGYRASRNIANSIYHAMTIKYEKRFSRGLSVVAHYTISKMLSDSDVSGSDVNFIAGDSSIQDYFNLRNERSLSAFDVPQRLVVSFDYQLPLGRGRTLGKSMNRVLDAVVGGWEVSGIISAASRTPLGITQSASTLWIGSQRPNQIGDPTVQGAVRDKLNNYFNVKAFSTIGPDLIGSDSTLPFDLSRTEPGQRRCHADEEFLHQGTQVVQLRLEAYGVTNSPQWGTPTPASAVRASVRSPARAAIAPSRWLGSSISDSMARPASLMGLDCSLPSP